MPIGSADEGDTLSSVWHGKKVKELRDAIARNALHPVCAGAGCSYVRSKVPTGKDLETYALFGAPTGSRLHPEQIALARLGRASSMHLIGTDLIEQARAEYGGSRVSYFRKMIEGLRWIWRAHKRGNPYASTYLSIFITTGDGEVAPFVRRVRNWLGRNEFARKHAIAWARMGMNKGFGPAATALGGLLSRDANTADTLDAVLDIFKRAGDLGDANGYLHAGNMLKSVGSDDDANHMLKLAHRRNSRL